MLTYDEYTALGYDTATEETFTGLEMVSANLIDAQTFGVIGRASLMEDEHWSKAIRTAVAMQVEFLARNYGSLEEVEKASLAGPVSSESETVGGYAHSVSYGSNRKAVGVTTVKGVRISPYVEFLIGPLTAMGRRM